MRRITSRLTHSAGIMLLMLAAWQSAAAEPRAHREGNKVHKQFSIKMPGQTVGDPRACAASIYLSYQQRGERARVDAEISNTDCGASSGAYELEIRLMSGDGERRNLRFSETWAREDDQALEVLEVRKFYPIGTDVTMRSIRLRLSECLCADAVADAATD